MHRHQNDKNEMTISSLNITYLYSSFPHGKEIVLFLCTGMTDDWTEAQCLVPNVF